MSPNRALPLLSGLLALSMLPGCQTNNPASTPDAETRAAQAQAKTTFVRQFQQVLIHDLAAANRDGLSGSLSLMVTLDRQNRPVACEVQRTRPSLLKNLPQGQSAFYPQALSDLVVEQCWKGIYPRVPAHMIGDDKTIDVLAPLFVLPQGPEGMSAGWRTDNARRDFFWQQLMREQPVDSIGVASVIYRGDAQGKVLDCVANLHPNPLRPDAYKVNGTLQETLSTRCKALDLRAMPGFEPDAQGMVLGSVLVEYAPWKVGRR
ncbi:MAG TPA: hypothetical protein VJS90_02085 [Pseudomonas sp.]|uniref:hypothetical protein n=1 Tax=Pseudomonas sp. TaxID=306 RepID=UPI002B49E200|nr:hypothetical protein [Pseudomonas sp.]HKS11805.1 hypothetical protein [Pseudomonas sp.]